jgi:hypothetical protein
VIIVLYKAGEDKIFCKLSYTRTVRGSSKNGLKSGLLHLVMLISLRISNPVAYLSWSLVKDGTAVENQT